METTVLIIIIGLSWAFIVYIASIVQKLRKEVKHQKQLVYMLRHRLGDKQDDPMQVDVTDTDVTVTKGESKVTASKKK